MPFIPHTEEETRAMLDVVGVRSLDDLFAEIPESLRPRSFDLPRGLSEMEVCARLETLAGSNAGALISFLGGGYYDHHIPKAVDALAGRGEFLTAYTPYQPEVAQGTLQAIFEYQSAVCRLFDMDCANASLYDGGSALFEAAMMAVRHTRRKRLILDEAVNPLWRAMLEACTAHLDLDLLTVAHKNGESDKSALLEAVRDTDKPCAGVIVQNPNFFGVIDDYSDLFAAAAAGRSLGIISVYPVMQALLKTPGEMGADIAVAEGQSLSLPLSFGGPYLGIMTCSKALVRQMPGRVAGRAVDRDGKIGYVLTIQAREQHIRRAKATSNICSNQALCALRSLMHLALLGPEGLARTAELSMDNARCARERFCAIPGVRALNDAPFGNEFAIVLPENAMLSMPPEGPGGIARAAADAMTRCGYVPGLPLGSYYRDMDRVLLVACTEKHSKEQIGLMADKLGAVLAGASL